jgi:sugar phosphate isomerase/epimerase
VRSTQPSVTRPISLAALTVLELTPPLMVQCAAEAGYSHVGIRLLPATPNEPQYDLVGDTPLLREVESRLAATGLKVFDVEVFRIKPDTRVAADCEAAMATAARLGASTLLVIGNDPEASRQLDTYGQFCDLARRYALSASLEFLPWTDVKNLTQAAQVVQAAARDNAAVLVDAFHFSRSRSRIEDIAAIPASRFHYLQLCDAPAAIPPTLDQILAEARSERLFPGEGGVDLLGILRALPRHIPISIEVPTHTLAKTVGATERARRALAATRRVLAQLDA